MQRFGGGGGLGGECGLLTSGCVDFSMSWGTCSLSPVVSFKQRPLPLTVKLVSFLFFGGEGGEAKGEVGPG